MSTPTTTPTPTTSNSRPTGWIIATVIAAGLALAGIIAALLMVLGSPGHASKTNDFFYPGDSTTTSGSTSGGSTSGGHHNRPNPPVRPSQTIKLLQEQLGQLNYYNGPATGYMNNSTVQAIRYLQRDAHLPQTGQLNTATENALNAMLNGGNNQMNTNNNGNIMNN